MEYIDKDALVAEIESKEKYAQTLGDNAINGSMQQFYDGMKQGCVDILSSLDTLEVKEVDLEKCYHEFLQKEWFGKNCNRTMSEMMAFTAKHFFELGLKASNPLTWEDIAQINSITNTLLNECKDEILYDTEEEFSKEVLKRFKAQKGE